MRRGLVLAEKPSLMRSIQDVYKKISGYKYELDFMAFHGGAYGFAMPEAYDEKYKAWADTSNLPIIPERWEYTVSEDSRTIVSSMCKAIKTGNYDFLVNACDAGREGENIFWSFYEATHQKLPVLRYWASENTPSVVKAALLDLRPGEEYSNLRKSAKIREQMDWLVGMNFSRAIGGTSGVAINVGRVKSPTLKIIVDREKEIENFVSEPFFEVKATFEKDGEEFPATLYWPDDYKETRSPKKSNAEKALDSLKKKATVESVTEKTSKMRAELLFSLSELQMAANSKFKYTPDKTLSITQKLYEDGYVSYPRTSSRFLSNAMIPILPKHIAALTGLPGKLGKVAKALRAKDVDRMVKSGLYINDAKITDHHAIMPTDQPFDWNSHSKDEQNIYGLIAKQFLAIFLPPMKFSSTVVTIDDNENIFKAKGMIILKKGYTILNDKDKSDTVLPKLEEGARVRLNSVAIVTPKANGCNAA